MKENMVILHHIFIVNTMKAKWEIASSFVSNEKSRENIHFINIKGPKNSSVSKVKKSSCDTYTLDRLKSKSVCSNHLSYFTPTREDVSYYSNNKGKTFDSRTIGKNPKVT